MEKSRKTLRSLKTKTSELVEKYREQKSVVELKNKAEALRKTYQDEFEELTAIEKESDALRDELKAIRQENEALQDQISKSVGKNEIYVELEEIEKENKKDQIRLTGFEYRNSDIKKEIEELSTDDSMIGIGGSATFHTSVIRMNEVYQVFYFLLFT
jgi:uncharacterized protein (DUF3084 family)